MRKITSLAFIVIIFVFGPGCKKDPPVPFQSYLKFKLDGILTECKTNITAYGSDHSINFSGSWSQGSIEMSLYENNLLSPGIYNFQSDKSRRATLWLDIMPGLTRLYYAGDGGVTNMLYGSGQITITEITPGYVKGTFDFETGIEMPSNTYKTVTEGEFYIKKM